MTESIYDFLPDEYENITMNNVVSLVASLQNDTAINEIGKFLSYFFDDLKIDNMTSDTVIEMLLSLPEELADPLFQDIQEIIDNNPTVAEGVTSYMQRSNINRKKRKFFTLSRADLISTRSKRKLANIISRSSRRQYYSANKTKIAKYQASRKALIAKGQHHVKLRRKV